MTTLLFSGYTEIERTFEVTIADNGFILKINAKTGEDDAWATDYSFVFNDLPSLNSAIDTLTELV
tara:strand:- start:14 stop:208 length:195 start_codon:yes stop_codon:yes gene_type:complete